MREQLDLIVSVKFHIGITPAHAGTTNSFNCVTLTCQDHPRSCGNNYPAVLLAFYQTGSPPLMREQLSGCSSSVLSNGITPAHAGTTSWRSCIRPFHEDHPRSCGNNLTFSVCLIASLGSPPLMREQPLTAATTSGQSGITPAHAGTT